MLTGEMTPTACEDEDRELRRQAILGMAHYARHALSPLMHNMLLRLLAEEEAKDTKDKRLRYG